jgi:hypothetical protein
VAEAAESFPINIESKDNATLISLAKLQGRATGSKGLTGDFDRLWTFALADLERSTCRTNVVKVTRAARSEGMDGVLDASINRLTVTD